MAAIADGTPQYLDAPKPLAMAHRGGATYPPNVGLENTIAAFRRAVEYGYQYLETDVRATRDGIPVLMHDETLQRLADRPEAVADLSWEELQGYRIGGREPVPSLPEVLAAFPDVRLNLDIKSDDALIPALAAVWAAGAEERVCLAANSDRRLRRIRRLAGPRVATSSSAWEVILLMFSPFRRWRATGRRRGASSVQVPVRNRGVTVISERFVRRAHELGLQVHVWVVDDETSARDLLRLGVDGLIADRIDVLRTVLDEMAR